MAFKNEEFVQSVYFAHAGAGNGASAADPKPISDGAAFDIEAGMVITNVSVVVTTSITGTTQVDVGDGTDPDGFVSAATLTAGAVTASDGAYLTGGLEKYYSAADTIDLDATGASTAGAFVVHVVGYKV